MWSKLSSALKPRSGTPVPQEQDDDASPEVLKRVYELHPNMSVFHEEEDVKEDVPFPSSSPPASPSKHGRRGIFKRMPKPDRNDYPDPARSSSPIPLKLSLELPERARSPLQGNFTPSEPSPMMDGQPRSSYDAPRSANDLTGEPKFGSLRAFPKKVKSSLHILSTGSDSSSSRSSTDAPRPSMESQLPTPSSLKPPSTPVTDAKFGSLRPILRDRNTPATGQSVRFFSRDAYRIISPDVSRDSEPEDMSMGGRLQFRSTPIRPAVQDVFSPSAGITPSHIQQLAPPNVSNIFDLSDEAEFPTIPVTHGSPLLDSAIEIPDGADDSFDVPPAVPPKDEGDDEIERPTTPVRSSGMHDRSQSFSFGQTVFRASEADRSGSSAPGSKVKASRSRALSDTVFHTMGLPSSTTAASPEHRPEADINDVSSGALVSFGSPERKENREKDPFGAHATAYYTPGTAPPTPSSGPISAHSRTASREEDIIWNLRTQLALQSELCVQFEVDLNARDELVRELSSRLEVTERESERRRAAARACRKRVAELEKCIRGLEEEVERSREESAERSVMDEASGAAMKALHGRIGELERGRRELEKKENELAALREELKKREDAEHALKAGIRAAKEEMESMGSQRASLLLADIEDGARGRGDTVEDAQGGVAWEEERMRLMRDNDELRQQQTGLQHQLTNAREEALKIDNELHMIRAELEAQWKHTEQAGERVSGLEKERDALKAECDALRQQRDAIQQERDSLKEEAEGLAQRIENMEEDWSLNENRKVELEAELQEMLAIKDELEHERNEFDEQLQSEHEHADQLTHALQEREERVTVLEREQQYLRDTQTRLETRLRERDTEMAELAARLSAQERAAETAQEELAKTKREHARTVNEQARTLQDVQAREVEARVRAEALVREHAETSVRADASHGEAERMKEEVERLRKQVHDLQLESADKEVRLVNLAKLRARDHEDVQGLNIALDSKQQELELLKRRMGVRGSAGTPSATVKVPHRRESSIFGTPSVSSSRPSSVLSDASSTAKHGRASSATTPGMASKSALRSARTNGSIVTAKRSLEGAMGPPPSANRSSASVQPEATPTRIPSSSGRAIAAAPTPSTIGKTTVQRRASSSVLDPSKLRSSFLRAPTHAPSSAGSETDDKEKENAAPATKVVRRLSAIPA
ncbi:hypothetical protein CERSUDRAFT_97191 [Gelatoporia subvermispora B]|uniref:Uncharacterized protein n=1 Tax=Ceriporiopsis subvermispora (strain B) TaxID=914234 RepID=M2QQZ4_CERS8|nr:hypothetical protein CERSUDRAFT_97191 [Gelatoporia subvermispora B]